MKRLGVGAALVAGRWVRGDVAVEAGRVTAIGLSPAVGSNVVTSGFVDHQINGFAGVDFRSADEAGYRRVAHALVETGVTAFHPTLYSMGIGEYRDALGLLREVQERRGADNRQRPGRRRADARVCGAHLEGPFLSAVWKGAHDERLLMDPDPAVLESLLGAGPVDLVTLAPELPGAVDLIRRLSGRGVRVSIGHTDATSEQARDAFDTGASMITHGYNAHRRFGARDPGPMGAALVDDRVAIGLIADGVHVADDALRLVARAAPDRMVLVTDAIAAAGVDPSSWNDTGSSVTVADGAARLADGTLAGSVATMDRCIRKMIGLGVPSEVVLGAAGGDRLRPGRAVDLVILDDAWKVVDVHIT